MSLNASFVKTLPFYIKESQQALAILCELNFLDQNKFIFSMDITSLYIVIPSFNDEGFRALKTFIEPSSETLLRLAELVLNYSLLLFIRW